MDKQNQDPGATDFKLTLEQLQVLAHLTGDTANGVITIDTNFRMRWSNPVFF